MRGWFCDTNRGASGEVGHPALTLAVHVPTDPAALDDHLTLQSSHHVSGCAAERSVLLLLVLLDADQPEVLVLATGDGRVTTFGTGFGLQAARALKRDWCVEVWSWREQLSGTFARLQDAYPGRLRVHELDPFYYSITFVKAGVYTLPGSTGPIHLTDRVVSPLLPGLKVY